MEKKKALGVLQRIANFQQENVQILKSKEAYGYNYAPLDIILPVILPLLNKYGLGYYHVTGYDKESYKNTLTTVIFSIDNSNDFIKSDTLIDNTIKLAKMNQFMVEGSAITYFRRYHLVTMLGLTTDEDNDAGGGKKKATGRSVETVGKETETDFYKIFSNLIEKGKTKVIVLKMLEQYKTQIDVSTVKRINDLITEKFK